MSRGTATLNQFRTQQTAALLAYVAFYSGRGHLRDRLGELFWPNGDRESAAASLSTSLWWLRREMERLDPEREWLKTDRSTVQFLHDGASCDATNFEAHARKALSLPVEFPHRLDELQRAGELYRGELLPRLDDDWARLERSRLSALHVRLSRELINGLEMQGRLEAALEVAFGLVQADPRREEGWSDLIRLHLASGRVRQAEDALHEMRAALEVDASQDTVRALSRLSSQVEAAVLRVSRAPAAVHRPVSIGASMSSPGGALGVASPYYETRACDSVLMRAVSNRESIILVKGARQMGKTSLIARGLAAGRAAGATTLSTDIEALSASELESPLALYQSLAGRLSSQLDLDATPEWSDTRSPGAHFERFVRRSILGKISGPVIWALDGVDRLFTCPFGSEIFRLFRSWYNARALEPEGPWSRLTLIIAYASEVHLFIRDPNQSPFNVGTHLVMEDLTPAQVAALNERVGSPIDDSGELRSLYGLIGGHPYLVQQALHQLQRNKGSLSALIDRADCDPGPFGSHLRSLLAALTSDADLLQAVRSLTHGMSRITPEAFYRLRSSGVVAGDSERAARLRCRLYERYFARHLAGDTASDEPRSAIAEATGRH